MPHKKPGHSKRKQSTGREGRGRSRGCQTQLGPHTALLGKEPFLPPGSDYASTPRTCKETLADTGSLPSQSRTRKAVSTAPRNQAQSSLLPQDTLPCVGAWGPVPRLKSRIFLLTVGGEVLGTGPTSMLVFLGYRPWLLLLQSWAPLLSAALVLQVSATSTLPQPGPWPLLQGRVGNRKTYQGTCQRRGRTEVGAPAALSIVCCGPGAQATGGEWRGGTLLPRTQNAQDSFQSQVPPGARPGPVVQGNQWRKTRVSRSHPHGVQCSAGSPSPRCCW